MKNIFVIILFILLSCKDGISRDWFFDINSIGGTCNNSSATGDITHPFCNPYTKIYSLGWAGPAAGDTIWIRGGTYTGPQWRFTLSNFLNGTAENPIAIKAYPGETVIFNTANSNTDWIQNLSAGHNYIHFLGPFKLVGFSEAMDDSWPASPTNGWRIENIEITGGASGFYARYHNGLIYKNIYCHDLKGFPDRMDDHNICVGSDGQSGQIADNITFDNITCQDINDGKGAENGDSDCVWTDEYNNHVTIRNVVATRMGEDGVDTKGQNVTMRNIVTYNNGATGVKLWGGNQNRISTYNVSNILTYGNSETGVKCSGNGDTVNAVIDHVTSYANGEDNIKNAQGFGNEKTAADGILGSNGCNMTFRNSLVGNGTLFEAILARPDVDARTTANHLYNVNITHPNNGQYAISHSCSTLVSRYTVTQYTDGTFNTDMLGGQSCGTAGSMTGSATNPTSVDPLIVSPPEPFVWKSIAISEITSDTLTLSSLAEYSWPTLAVGEYIELNDDGVRREIVSFGNSTNRTITFAPAVTTPLCGRETDCQGTRVIGWGSDNTITAIDVRLQPTSPIKDAGLYVENVHCPTAGATGDCVTWHGNAPDLGYKEWVPPGKRYKRRWLPSTP